MLATVCALPIVLGAGRFLPYLFPYSLAVPVGADARVFAFLVAAGLTAGVLFGIVPAWAISRRGIALALREGAAGARRGTRLGDGLVAAQLALSLGLVAGAALLGRSVLNAHTARPGFEPDGLAAAFLDVGATGRYEAESGVALYDRLVRELERLPGVAGATIANQTPLAGGHSRASAHPSDRRGDDAGFEAEYIIVGPSYFETMGIPLVRGRALGGVRDEPEDVVIVNQALAGLFWPGESAIGKRIDANARTWRIVGVAGDVQMRSLRSRAQPAVYYPLSRVYDSAMVLHMRGASGRAPDDAAIREAIGAVDAALPVSIVVDLRDGLASSLAETRTIALLVGAFALLAIVLSAVGLYGLVAYGAAQRVRELAIRIALGARPTSIVRLIVARGLAIALLGAALGLGFAYALGRALEGLLFGVGARDPVTIGMAALVLVTTAAAAAWLPARRASRLDAARSLRS